MGTTYYGTASGLNGSTIPTFNPGDQIDITDETPAQSNVSVSGNHINYTGGSITIGSLASGRLFVRPDGNTGTDVRLQQIAHNDFSGDGASDVLWQQNDGTLTDWLGAANGGFTGNWSNFNTSLASGWHVVGTGDFNGDGQSDLLLRNDSGTVNVWLGQSNGSFVADPSATNNLPTSWHIVGVGDFGATGHADVLWQNSDGTVTDWVGNSDGTFTGNWNNFHNNPGTNWTVVGTGDFNGDGHEDVLWEENNGTLTDWLGAANASFTGNWSNFNTSLGSGWHVVGTGDFNGDGRSDLLLRNDSGTVNVWLGQLNGSFTPDPGATNNLPATWHIVGVGDYNKDGIDDVLWQNSDGTVTDWLGNANGTFTGNWNNFHNNPGTAWHVVDPFVHDTIAG